MMHVNLFCVSEYHKYDTDSMCAFQFFSDAFFFILFIVVEGKEILEYSEHS